MYNFYKIYCFGGIGITGFIKYLQCDQFDYKIKCSATPCDLAVIIVYYKCLSGFVYKRNVQFNA